MDNKTEGELEVNDTGKIFDFPTKKSNSFHKS